MSGTAAPVRQDASLSLLQRIVDGSLDPSYAEAARRRADERHRAPATGSGLAVATVLAVLGLLLASVVSQTWRSRPDLLRSHAQLVERVEAATLADAAGQAELQALTEDVERLQRSVLADEADAAALERRLAALEVAAGVTAVSGPGVKAVIDDGPAHRADGVGPDLARVLDRDLQLLVNGLFAAGAEAVAVSGQRITTTTAIRSAGDAVLVGYRPLARPYVVTAIGDPRTLEARFAESEAGRTIQALARTYSMPYALSTEDRLSLPGVAATTVRYARHGEG